jgi:hypothetical protein
MTALFMLGAAGVWAAVPLTGFLVFGFTPHTSSKESWPLVTVVAVMAAVGLAVWSPILLGAAIAGVYRADLLGLLGWAVSACAVAQMFTQRKTLAAAIQPLSTWDWVLAGGLLLAAALYLGFPGESIYGGRDEGVYASHAVFVAHHGTIDVPYPWPPDAQSIFFDKWVGFPGFYKTANAMTVQFGHLLPMWMAQAYATLGAAGLFRVNAVFALLAVAVFYGACRTVLPPPYAVAAALFLAFNPSQLWMARITLSEIAAQLFIWSGLLLLFVALPSGERGPARWAGVLLGLSAFVRFDSLLMVPMLFLAHLATRLIEEPTGKSTPVWLALYQTAVPVFALALAYFAVFSTPYLMQRPYLGKLAVASIVTALLLLACRPTLVQLLRPWLAARTTLIAVGIVWFAVAIYAYFIRSARSPAPQMQYRWPGYYIDTTRDYSRDALVNLGRYLSPPVVWAAIGGWFGTLALLVRQRRDLHLFAALVILLGFSVAHLTEPIPEDHFWVVRRFTPVVIPGFVLCAALAAHWLISKVPAGASVAVAGLTAVALAGFTLWADRLILTSAESSGYFAQIEALARKLPRDELILARGFTEWITPLYVAFDRHVVPLNLDPNSPGRAAFQTWIAKQTAQGKKTYLLIEGATDLRGIQHRKLDDFVITREFTEPTVNPLPQKLVTKQRRIELYEITAGP